MGRKSIHSPEHKALLEVLRDARREAGLTQEALAAALGKRQSFVSKYEAGERRLDVVELREIALAMGITLAALARRFELAVERD